MSPGEIDVLRAKIAGYPVHPCPWAGMRCRECGAKGPPVFGPGRRTLDHLICRKCAASWPIAVKSITEPIGGTASP